MRSLADIVHLRGGACSEAASAITEIAAGEDHDVDPGAAEHVGSCLRCQAEVASYQRVMRTMRLMRGQQIEVPAGQIAAVVAVLGAAAEQHSASWAARAAYVGGITVATAAAGVAGVMVWVNRRRPLDTL